MQQFLTAEIRFFFFLHCHLLSGANFFPWKRETANFLPKQWDELDKLRNGTPLCLKKKFSVKKNPTELKPKINYFNIFWKMSQWFKIFTLVNTFSLCLPYRRIKRLCYRKRISTWFIKSQLITWKVIND